MERSSVHATIWRSKASEPGPAGPWAQKRENHPLKIKSQGTCEAGISITYLNKFKAKKQTQMCSKVFELDAATVRVTSHEFFTQPSSKTKNGRQEASEQSLERLMSMFYEYCWFVQTFCGSMHYANKRRSWPISSQFRASGKVTRDSGDSMWKVHLQTMQLRKSKCSVPVKALNSIFFCLAHFLI